MNDRIASVFVVSILLIASGIVYAQNIIGDLIDEGSLVLRDEIFILGNDQFTLKNGVVGGSGSENDPYIIENWTMDNAQGGRIEIIDTNSHLVIRNCRIWGYPNEGDAVVLRRASNISIQNCLIGNLDEGIAIRDNTWNITIKDCKLQDINDGIRIRDNANNINIINCTLQKIREGIDLHGGANNITIQNCIMEEMDEGVVILSNSENITINDCSFKRIVEGLDLFGGYNIDIHDNFFLWNSVSMRLERITSSKIWNNSIIGTEYTSILLDEESNDNHVHHNIILRESDDYPFYKDDVSGVGIVLYQSANNTIEFNHCADMRSGILFRFSAGCNILNNKIHFDSSLSTDVDIIGISMEMSPYSLLENNSMINCGFLLSGGTEIDFSTINIDKTNKVDGSPIRMIKDEDKQIDLEGDYSQLILVNCSDIDIIDANKKTKGVFLTMASCEDINIRKNRFNDLFGFLYMWNCKKITVKNNSFADMTEALAIHNSTDLIITDNEITDAYYGILGSYDKTLVSNNIFKNLTGSIRLMGVDDRIVNNTIINGSKAVYMIGHMNDVRNNKISDQSDEGLYISHYSSRDFNYDEYKGSLNNDIDNNIIFNCSTGIKVHKTDNSISNNTIVKCHDGIGIHMDGNNVTSNKIVDNVDQGIFTSCSSNNIVMNAISGNKIGIRLYNHANLNTILQNSIIKNSLGISLDGEVTNTSLKKNFIYSNDLYGISVSDGSAHNKILWNSLYKNNAGDIQALDNGSSNIWDDGSEKGNYWDDYSTRYVNASSSNYFVWDTSYDIDGSSGSSDRYPLVNPCEGSYKLLTLIIPEIPNATIDDEFSMDFDVETVRVPDDDIAWELETNTSWLQIDQNGFLNGTPGVNDTGSFFVEVSVSDGYLKDVFRFTINVTDKVIIPSIRTSDVLSVDQDAMYLVDYESEGEGLISWSMGTSAGFLSLNTSTGVLSGIPSNDDVGSYWVNISLFGKGILYDHTNFSLIVNNVNDPPTSARIDIGNNELEEGESQVLTIEIIDPDIEYGDTFNITWTIEGIGLVGYGSTVYLSLSKGIYSLSIMIIDGNGSTIYLNTSINVKDSGSNDQWPYDNIIFEAVIITITVILIILIMVGIIIFRKRRSSELTDNEPADIVTADSPISDTGKIHEMIDRDNITGGYVNFPVYTEDMGNSYGDAGGRPIGLMSSMPLMEDIMEEVFTSHEPFDYSDDHIMDGLQVKYSEGDISHEELNLIISTLSGEE